MSRTDAERMEDIHAAIARCMAYRDLLDSAELGEMANDAILRVDARDSTSTGH